MAVVKLPWWARMGVVMIVFAEVVMLPFTLTWGWDVALTIPVMVIGIGAFMWVFDKAIRWVDDA